MPTPTDFFTYTQWSGLLGLLFAALAGLGFLFKWSIRFRLVGATGFMGVLTVGLLALSIVPLSRAVVPGATRFTTVYDSGANLATIVVAPTITEDELRATLQQASSDLFTAGRLGRGQKPMLIRARTVFHVKDGLSQPLYLAEHQRSLPDGASESVSIRIYSENFAKLPRPRQPETPKAS
jgi:Protein of function (DUF2518)